MEPLNVKDVAAFVLLVLRMAELALRIALLLRELFRGGRTPRKRARRGARTEFNR